MKYIIDNDLHIHSVLSSCSDDPEQTTERILKYAEDFGLKTICVTNHFWDETVEGASEWYTPQNFPHISKELPLPQKDGIRFLFGCETDLDKFLTLGLAKERAEVFDFIVIPTTHFHMKGFTLHEAEAVSAEARAKSWVRRLNAVLDMDLPFHKVGIAHLTCKLIAPEREEYIKVIELLSEDEMYRLFKKAAKLGAGIEINSSDMSFAENEEDIVLRPYRIAKECGCKFYLGSDAHHPAGFEIAIANFERAINLLGLSEQDKFRI